MDPNRHIYIAPEDEIPAEDKSRLDGYLRGRAEADAKRLAEDRAAIVEEMQREIERLERERA